jgi:hypothetical protein
MELAGLEPATSWVRCGCSAAVISLSEVDSIEVKRMGLAGVVEVVARGSSFKLEGKVGDRGEFAEAVERATGSA